MDRQFIEQSGLTEAVKRFQQINEYTFITAPILDEADDDPNDPNQQGMGQQAPQGQGQDMMPPQDQGQQMPQGPQAPPQGQGMPQQPMQEPMMGQEPMQGGEEMIDINMEEPPITEPMQPEDEVIDVDELTNAQEETEFKLDGVEQKLGRLLDVVNKFTDALAANDQKIAELSDEFKKRNPTETEKMNIRSQAGAPFTENPKEYWENKSANDPHYDVMFDNGVPTADEQREFEIRQSDVDNYNDMDIEKTFKPLKLTDFLRL